MTSPTTYSAVGDVITYSYNITNSGNVTLTGQFSVADDHLGSPLSTPFSCGPPATTLNPGATVSCTATYTISQADLNAASVTNSATATGAGQTSNAATATVTAVQSPSTNPTKSASATTYSTVGTIITYTYTITNSGNVTLTGQFSVADDHVGGGTPFDCGPAATTLNPVSYTHLRA